MKISTSEILKRIPFLAILTNEELAEVERSIPLKQYSKNDVILLEDNTPNFMYVVYTGMYRQVLKGKNISLQSTNRATISVKWPSLTGRQPLRR
jgi:signal-transduction protein with cAMP-binding, CBS, and nucleotidyltransferase domain